MSSKEMFFLNSINECISIFINGKKFSENIPTFNRDRTSNFLTNHVLKKSSFT